MGKVAVVVFTLGAPDSLDAVRPFLFNLFSDPAIIGVPQPLRWLIAELISRRRAPEAREIYAELGGASPLLDNTRAQATALEEELRRRWRDEALEARVFTAMRYWHPRSPEVARAVKDFAPDRVVLLPLYPQYSTATSASSLRDWKRAAAAASLRVPEVAVCCYPEQAGFVAEAAGGIATALERAREAGRPRVLFSAHGLPERTVAAGDPYQWQVERTVGAVVEEVKRRQGDRETFDWVVCYQSRVGPLEWIKPYTEAEIERAGREKVPAIVVPIAFVSEHSETLVELDITYRRLADECGVPMYVRVPTVGVGPDFIAGLADLVDGALDREAAVCSASGDRICPPEARRCAMAGR